MIVTLHTEYHMRGRTCVRVRDRHTGQWLDNHQALMLEMIGAYGPVMPDPINVSPVPKRGERVFFDAGDRPLITTAVIAVERPPKQLVEAAYPPADAAG